MSPKEIIIWPGFEIHSYLEKEDTAGCVTLFKVVLHPDTKMPAPHFHEGFDETIVGIKGVSTYTIGGKIIEIGPGGSVFIPKGVVHGFANQTSEIIEFLAFINPAIFGVSYFREIAVLLNAGGPPDIVKLKEIMKQYGLVPVMAQ